MSAIMWNLVIADTAAMFIGLIFAAAAWHKIGNFDSLRGFIADYQVVPVMAVAPVALGIVIGEMAVPVSLLFAATRFFGAILAVSLLSCYAAAIAINLLRGRTAIDCGCGGAAQPLAWSLIARNGGLSGTAALILLSRDPAVSCWEAATALGAGTLLWSSYAFASQVLSNQSRLRALLVERR